MSRCFLLCLILTLSAVLSAQQDSSKPPSSTSKPREPSAAERNPFPEEDSAASADPARKSHTSTMAPPRSDSVQVDDLGASAGESSSKDTQVDLSPPSDDAKAHPQSSAAVADAEAAALD